MLINSYSINTYYLAINGLEMAAELCSHSREIIADRWIVLKVHKILDTVALLKIANVPPFALFCKRYSPRRASPFASAIAMSDTTPPYGRGGKKEK